MESCLLLFSHERPCWDEETLALAGEDPHALKELEDSGDLMRIAAGCGLTPQGVRTRERVARELCVPVSSAGEVPVDEVRAREMLERNRLEQFLDRAFMTDWGIKEVSVGETFPVVPCLLDDEYFMLSDGRARALWPEAPVVKSFLEAFPHWGVAARTLPAPGQEALDRWGSENGASTGTLTFDFVLRSRYDFNHYKGLDPLPTDRFKFLNADRLFAQKVRGRAEDLLPLIGRLHIFLMEQRRIYVPGWFDIDREEQEDWVLLALATDTEAQLASLTVALRAWGHDLIDPANPLYIVGTSIERLREQREQKRTLYDWFQEETVRILRPDAPDEVE